eukprot:11064191-Lingulodinium_polyedra.AAC.1
MAIDPKWHEQQHKVMALMCTTALQPFSLTGPCACDPEAPVPGPFPSAPSHQSLWNCAWGCSSLGLQGVLCKARPRTPMLKEPAAAGGARSTGAGVGVEMKKKRMMSCSSPSHTPASHASPLTPVRLLHYTHHLSPHEVVLVKA